MRISDLTKVTPLGFNLEVESLPDIIGEHTKLALQSLIERGYDPYAHDIDIRPVYSNATGYSTLQVRVFPRKARA
jgi:hypothetical protein